MSKLKIGVVRGGISSEREVSLKSGEGIIKELNNQYQQGCRKQNHLDTIECKCFHVYMNCFLCCKGTCFFLLQEIKT